MTQIQKLEHVGHEAVLNLRLNKFKRGRPFMITSPNLPSYQCYMEYSDGKIAIEQISPSGNDFIKVRLLSPDEALQLRNQLGLIPFGA